MSVRILVAYDGSDESETAVEHACMVGEAMDAAITVVHAVQPDVYEAASGDVQSNFADEYRREILRTIDDAEEEGLEYLREAERLAEEHGQDVSSELVYGDPVTKILEFVEDDFDMVILGHRGQSERTDAHIGSVAKSIIERADVPVTVTR